jgi:hypothetical protein
LIYKKTNINKSLLIEPYHGGLKLISPPKKSGLPLIKTIDFLLKLPMSFYLLDSEGQTQIINEEGAAICGYTSVEQSIGKSILAVGEKESSQQLIDNCYEVLTFNSVKIFDEKYIRKDGNQQQFLSIKCPWYDQNDKINGICGFSIVLGLHNLAGSLSFITQLNLLNQLSSVHQETFNFKRAVISTLTKREMDCLRLTVKGFTAKRIALLLSHN